MPTSVKAELIVLASPVNDADQYYAKAEGDIFDFHVRYARQISRKDDVLIFTDKQRYNDYAEALGSDRVVVIPMQDIWMRDFSLSNPDNPVMFRYTAAAQGSGKKGQKDADAVQKALVEVMNRAGISFLESYLLNDGGNFVEDHAGNVVVSKKFLRDNRLSEQEGRKRLLSVPGVKQVAFIKADEQGGLEHADGVASFVDVNTLIINSYPDDPDYSKQLIADLRRGLDGVRIYEIVTPHDNNGTYDRRFGSACGLYVNALVTPERIYFPQFGIPEDAIALKQVKAITSREVIPVLSSQICKMGGGIRCMSWQLRKNNAEKLINHVNRQNRSDFNKQ